MGIYGDGSAGALNITVDTNWSLTPPASDNLQFTNILVANGVQFTVPSGTLLRATGNITINGTITVSPGAQDSGNGDPNPGQSLAGPGGVSAGVALNKLQAGQLMRLGSVGGGAGSRNVLVTGGEGGGALVLRAAGSVSISGTINANGRNSVNPQTAGVGIVGGGGGAGGFVIVAAKGTLTVGGTIAANGGNGADGFDGNGGSGEGGGGGGGGGIVHLISSTTPTVTGSIQTNGGAAGVTAAGTGTPAQGGGGGACGGNGGQGGGTIFSTVYTSQAGSAGYTITTVTASPENLFL
jgi:hypothetical protein